MCKWLLVNCVLLSLPQAWGSLSSPNVSANALFLYRQSNFSNEEASTVRNGADVQEAEVAFFADVDPYSRLNILLSVHPEYEYDSTAGKVSSSWVIEPEELFAESDHVPGVTLRAGKFKAAFGKHNLLHTHVFPFTDAPVANVALLGGEGLNDTGLSAAALLPVPWFSELTLQFLRGEGENEEFKSPSSSDGVGVGHFKNLWDLSDSATLEAGFSYAQGPNSLRKETSLAGADLTYKWKPSAMGRYHSVIFAGEVIQRQTGQPRVAAEQGSGWNVWGQYQLSERLFGQFRYDHLEVSHADKAVNANALDNVTTRKYTVSLLFRATEFSAYRLEYDQAEGPASLGGETVERKLYLQANFTIGAHPAHAY